MEDKFDINNLTPEELYQKGIDNCSSDELDALFVAIECFTKCVEVGYTPEDIYYYIGIAYNIKGIQTHSVEDFTLSIEYYQKSIDNGYTPEDIYISLGKAYFNKGVQTDSVEDYTHSIEYYQKSIDNGYTPEDIYICLGIAYFKKGIHTDSVEDFTLSIEYYQKSIDNGYTPEYIYYYIGNAYFNKGIQTDSVEDFTLSIENQTLSMCRDYDKACVFYVRGLALQKTGKHYEAELDINSAIYQMFGSFDTEAIKVIDKMENTPHNYKLLAELYASKGVNVSPYFFTYTRNTSLLYDFLLFLDYMKFNAMELSISDGYSIGSASILTYYLGGCLTTYRVLDDQDTDELSVQELYYYYRSALDFSKVSVRDIGIADIIEEIENRPSLSDTDKYYLAQIYYLRAMDEEYDNKYIHKARQLFEESKSVIWSKAMTDVIDGTSKYQKDIERYIDTHCKEYNEIDITNIDTAEFWLQFNDFYHFREVNHTKPNFLPKCLFYDDIWNVFQLSGDKEEIADNGDEVFITDREKLERKIYQEKGYKLLDEIANRIQVPPLSEEDKDVVNEFFKKEFKNITDEEDVEEKAKDILKATAYNNKHKQIVLRYLLQENKIDKKQYTTLLLYHIIKEGIAKEFKDINKFAELSIAIIDTITKASYLVKILRDTLSYLFGNADKDMLYNTFKRRIWETMNNKYGHLELKDVDLLKKKR